MALKVGELFASLNLNDGPFNRTLAGMGHGISGLSHIAGMAALGIGAALAGGAVVAGAAILKIGMNYQDSLNIFQSVSGANTAQMAMVGETAKQLGNDLTLPGISAGDAATAMTQLAKAGLTVEQSMAAAKGVLQLSKAATTDVGTAADMTAAALNAFSLGGDQAVRVADLLAAAANSSMGEITDMGYAMSQSAAIFASAGISVEDLTASIAMLANKGILGSDAGTSLKTMLMSLQAPTGAAKTALDGLGVSLYNADGSTRGYRETIDSLSKALVPLTDAQKAQVIETIFGSDAARAANIIFGQSVTAFDKSREAVTKQGAAAEVAAAKSKGLSGAIENIKSTLETMAITIYTNVQGPMEQALRVVGDRLGDFSNKLGDIWARKDLTLTAKLEGSWEALYDIDTTVGRIADSFRVAGDAVVIFGAGAVSTAAMIGTTFMAGVIVPIDMAIYGIMAGMDKIMSMYQALGLVSAAQAQAATDAKNEVGQWVETDKNRAREWAGVWSSSSKVAVGATKDMADAIGRMGQAGTGADGKPSMAQQGQKAIDAYAAGIQTGKPGALNHFRGVAVDGVMTLAGTTTNFAAPGTGAANSYGAGMTAGAPAVSSAGFGLASTARTSAAADLSGVGRNIASSMASGMLSGVLEVGAAAAALADAARRKAQERLDAHSPSRVFQKIGQGAGDGFALGMMDRVNLVRSAMGQMVGRSMPGGGNPSSFALAGGGSSPVNNTYNITVNAQDGTDFYDKFKRRLDQDIRRNG